MNQITKENNGKFNSLQGLKEKVRRKQKGTKTPSQLALIERKDAIPRRQFVPGNPAGQIQRKPLLVNPT